jgi:hypothetical protein
MMAVGAIALWAQEDPPSRVARLSFLEGSVSLQQAGHDDWTNATPNFPLTIGDHLWADEGSRVEVHVGSTAIRMDAHTALAFLNLDDRMTQLRLSDGTLNITIVHLEDDEAYEVDTPNGAVSLLRAGEYRIDADPDRQLTAVTVRRGEAEVTAGAGALPLHPRQSVFITGEDQPQTEVAAAGVPNDFDRWAEGRDEQVARRTPPRYVSTSMAGYEDLDQYGTWRDEPGYGPVWRPRAVAADWAPYRYGHWVWVDPWGWTWVDDAPWGFAPFHYGRWALVGGGWVWVPGVYVARPVYAPALVAWVGGPSFGVSLAFGVGGGVGWFPLGPREVYIPAYRVSNTYITRVNITHVTNVTNITNVTTVRYVNQNVPGAVTAVSRTDFMGSRSVSRSAVVVPANAVTSATVTTREMPIAREQAMRSRPVGNVQAARPPQAITNAPVVTRTAPPAATVSLARPVGSTPSRAPMAVQPAAPAYRPPVTQSAPAYRPPATQVQPPYRPQTQTTQTQTQTAPPATYRPPVQSQPANRPPAAQAPPQALGHSHGPDRSADVQRRSVPERNRPDRGKESK